MEFELEASSNKFNKSIENRKKLLLERKNK